jgi:hypothetical protein
MRIMPRTARRPPVLMLTRWRAGLQSTDTQPMTLLRLAACVPLLAQSACNEPSMPAPLPVQSTQPVDLEGLRGRAVRALACIELRRAPQSWQSSWRPQGRSADVLWLDLRSASLQSHPVAASALYEGEAKALYLVLHGGLSNEFSRFGPLPQEPSCALPADQPSNARSPASSSTGTPKS